MNKEEQLLIRLTAEEKGKLKSMAKRENTTMADLIKSRVFATTDQPEIHKDLKGELKGINENLLLLLRNAVKTNRNQDKIVNLLELLRQVDQSASTGGKATIFDYLINHIREKYVEKYKKNLSNMDVSVRVAEESIYAKKEFEEFVSTLTEMKKRAYPNA